jgi:hypothetical protein
VGVDVPRGADHGPTRVTAGPQHACTVVQRWADVAPMRRHTRACVDRVFLQLFELKCTRFVANL